MSIFISILMICLMQHSSANTNDLMPTFVTRNWKSFNANESLLLIEVHNVTGDVYIAAVNNIYQLDADLTLKHTIATGPELDHTDCLHPPFPCQHKKTLTDNKPTVLKILYHMEVEVLMLCGTLYRGLCQIRPLQDLDNIFWIGPYNESVGIFTHFKFTTILSGPGYNRQTVFYSGSQYIPNLSSKLLISPDSIASRVLVNESNQFTFKYAYSSGLNFSGLNFGGKEKMNPRIVFIVGNYIYFLLASFNSGKEPNPISSLVRICLEDPTFHSYTELPMFCIAEGFHYYSAIHAVYNDADNKLLVAFVQNNDIYQPGDSAVCTYDLNNLNKKFDEAIEDCFYGSNFTHLRKPLSGDMTPCQEQADDEKKFCDRDVNPYISSKKWLELDPLLTSAVSVGKIILTQQNKYTVAFLLPVKRDIVQKYILSPFRPLNANKVFSGLLNNSDSLYMPPSFGFDKRHEHLYLLGSNMVVKYPIRTCSTYETCVSCMNYARHDLLECGWCDGHCAQRDECSNPASFSTTTCTPAIHKIKPLKGPLQGNQILIMGTDFDGFTTSTIKVTVAGIPCSVQTVNHEIILCNAGIATSEISGPVVLSLIKPIRLGTASLPFLKTGPAISKQNYSYVIPHLYGIYPSKGPVSGGTNVTFFGKHLHAGQRRAISIEGTLCSVISSTDEKVECTTSAAKEQFGFPEGVVYKLDNIAITMVSHLNNTSDVFGVPISHSFNYVLDPEIYNIYPTQRTVSGKMNVTVSGKYLDSVTKPYMLVKVLSLGIGELTFQEPCWLNPESNGTIMVCSTPELLEPETNTSIATLAKVPLVAHMAFVMDGVKELRNFPEEYEELSRLLYYPNPEYEPFNEIQGIPDSQATLKIKGKHLDSVYGANQTSIVVDGQEICDISALTTNEVQCVFPSDIISNSSLWGRNLSVEVFAGPFQQSIGYIVMISDEPTNNSLISILVPLVLIATLIIIATFFTCRFVRKRKRFLRNLKYGSAVENNDYGQGTRLPLMTNCKSLPVVDEDTLHKLELDNLIILKEHLICGNMIGRGQFGCVYEGTLHRPCDRKEIKVAVKEMLNLSPNDTLMASQFLNEALFMHKFHHENVLTLIGVCFQDELPVVVLPFMANGDLCSYLRKNKGHLYKDTLYKFQVDIAAGMAYLAQEKYVHRDLATRNCLLDENCTVKVADFGMSRDIYMCQYYTSQDLKAKLPFRWMAVEAIESRIYSVETDVWSFGVVMWEIMTYGMLPYCAIDNGDLLEYLTSNRRLPKPNSCSERLYEIMLLCWHINPEMRPTFEALKNALEELRRQLVNENTENSKPPVSDQDVNYENC